MNELLHFSLCLLAFNGFSLAKFSHFRDVFNQKPAQWQSNWLVGFSWISILLSLCLSIVKFGAYGSLLFCGYMALSLLIIMAFYSFKRNLVKLMSICNLILILLVGLFLTVY
ncbi:DUF3325 family protein [Pseudoalteromonas sp. AOP31-A2-14]|uniref:DUF3325 family protein n=1 Tax=unclassified Pseudoalteromonas TaxID=194690 RepID=UPI003F949DD2